VAKVAQSATATWPRNMSIRLISGPRDYFKTKFFLQGCNSNFFFTGTIVIFKPIYDNLFSINKLLCVFFLNEPIF